MRAWPVLLLLGGCASRDVADGLRVRLVAKEPFALGRSMIVELEATNAGSGALSFDVQSLGHRPFRVVDAKGAEVPFVDETAAGLGTFQHFVSLQPGETQTLGALDVGAEYAILAPGEYRIRFEGLPLWGGAERGWSHDGLPGSAVCAVPASAPLRFTVQDGPLSGRDRLLRALLPRVPEGWILYKTADGLAFQRSRVPGTALRACVDVRMNPVRLDPLVLRGKATRRPEDDRIEAELRAGDFSRLSRLVSEVLTF